MITLEYNLGELFLKELKRHDIAAADRTTIEFSLYPGSITFRINGANFDDLTGIVPVLGFALYLYDIIQELKSAGMAVLEFTESDKEIYFEYREDNVVISAKYSQDTGTVPFDELTQAVIGFLKKVMVDLMHLTPELKENRILKCYADEIGLDI